MTEQITPFTQAIKINNLEPETAAMLKAAFLPFYEKAKEWQETASSLVVTDETQTDLMLQARTARLALKDIRVQADKARKNLKEDSLRYGKAVQGLYNLIEELICPIESHLEKQEKFIEIQEANQRAILVKQRAKELEPFQEFVPYTDLGQLSEEGFQKLLTGCRLQAEAKIKREEEEAAEKKRQQEEHCLEQERIRKENELLKARIQQIEQPMPDIQPAPAEDQCAVPSATVQKVQKDLDALHAWVDSFEIPAEITLVNKGSEWLKYEIENKFEAFKKWAHQRITNPIL